MSHLPRTSRAGGIQRFYVLDDLFERANPAKYAALLGPGDAQIGTWQHDEDCGWYPASTIRPANAAAASWGSRVTDLLAPSAYSWTANGLLVTGYTRLQLDFVSGTIPRNKIRVLNTFAAIKAITLDGATGTARPRMSIGAYGPTKVCAGGIYHNGTNWVVGNEYGAFLVQGVTTVPAFAATKNAYIGQQLSPNQGTANTDYAPSCKVEDASGLIKTWSANTADSTLLDYGLKGPLISFYDTDVVAPIIPGGLITEIGFVLFKL